jgi:lipopolysaccharide export system protein LptC
MNIGSRSAIIYPIALLSILALMTAWINHVVQPPKPKLDGSSRHDPDYIMRNFVTTQTDINGDLRYKLASVEMRHFPDDDTTELQRPRYTQFAANKPYTQAHALRGYVSSDGEQVQLVDNVKITRQAFADKGEMTIDTEYLNILPNEDLVRTDSPVVIRQAPKTIIYATGMVYEKKTNTATLLHKVRAHYEKPGVKKTKLKKVAVGNSGLKKSSLKNSAIKPKRAEANKKKTATLTTVKTIHSKLNNSAPVTDNARTRRRYE